MLQKVLQYKDEDYNVELTVRQATVSDGIDRSVLVSQIYVQFPVTDADKDADSGSRVRRLLLLHSYPACIAATDIKNKRGSLKKLLVKMPMEAFLDLPEILVIQWEDAVFELNPHWDVTRREQGSTKETQGEAEEPNDETN